MATQPAPAPAAPPAPAPAAPAPLPPGWTTSEFWSTIIIDAIALVAMVLTFTTGSTGDLDSVKALVPAASVIMSAFGHAVYAHGRVQLKTTHLEVVGRMAEAKIRAAAPLAGDAAALLGAVDPALGRRVAAAEAAAKAVGGDSAPAS